MMKKISLSLLLIAALSIIVSSASLALFTATAANSSNSFASGTVTLGTPAGTAVNVTNIAPGDEGSGTYTVSYSGSLEAWLGVDISSSGDLFTCAGEDSLQVSITDGDSKVYDRNGANQVVGRVNDGDGATLTVAWNLPTDAGNGCQDKSASISVTFHAVQARNNTNGDNSGPDSWQ
jgi:spore coat-associated protein N